ncbi:hypothetical protein EMIT0P201_60318 [Pseudomonas chlororaphis]
MDASRNKEDKGLPGCHRDNTQMHYKKTRVDRPGNTLYRERPAIAHGVRGRPYYLPLRRWTCSGSLRSLN